MSRFVLCKGCQSPMAVAGGTAESTDPLELSCAVCGLVSTPDDPAALRPESFEGTHVGGVYRVDHFVAPLANGRGLKFSGEHLILQRQISMFRLVEPPQNRELLTRLTNRRDPYLVDVFELGETESATWMMAEYDAGMTLAEAMAEANPPWSPAASQRWIVQLLNALESLHKDGFAHRRIGPDTIAELTGGKIKLVDLFGIQQMCPAADDHLFHIGDGVPSALAALAPETALTGELSVATDIYAVGALLFRLLTGRLPLFDAYRLVGTARDAEDILTRICQSVPQLPFGPTHTSYDLGRVALKALAKQPKDRFETVGALRDAVRVFGRLPFELCDAPLEDTGAIRAALGNTFAPEVEGLAAAEEPHLTAEEAAPENPTSGEAAPEGPVADEASPEDRVADEASPGDTLFDSVSPDTAEASAQGTLVGVIAADAVPKDTLFDAPSPVDPVAGEASTEGPKDDEASPKDTLFDAASPEASATSAEGVLVGIIADETSTQDVLGPPIDDVLTEVPTPDAPEPEDAPDGVETVSLADLPGSPLKPIAPMRRMARVALFLAAVSVAFSIGFWVRNDDRADPSAARDALERPPAAVNSNEMVRVPGGRANLGPKPGSPDLNPHQRQPHTVHLSAFYIDRFEVKAAAFRSCVASGKCRDFEGLSAQPDDHPVTWVSHADASAYCAALGLRLPTEHEWEWAAGGGVGYYPWGRRVAWVRIGEAPGGAVRDPVAASPTPTVSASQSTPMPLAYVQRLLEPKRPSGAEAEVIALGRQGLQCKLRATCPQRHLSVAITGIKLDLRAVR